MVPAHFVGACLALAVLCGTATAQPPVAPAPHAPKPKPGTVECDIEALLDCECSWWNQNEPTLPAAYWRLAARGFDAVPALIEAINDGRATRASRTHFDPLLCAKRLSVGQLVGHLLNELSGRELGGFVGPQSLDHHDVRKWLERAKKVGEERWLVRQLKPEDVRPNFGPPANRTVYHALGAKYPTRLGNFYQTVLRRKPEADSHMLAEELALSKLPRARALALLEEGAGHKKLLHRFAAVAALADFDRPAFHKHLLAEIKRTPADIAGNSYWLCPEAEIVALVMKTDDRTCWDELAAVARRAKVGFRMELLNMSRSGSRDEGAKARSERLRFLIGFLSDTDARGEPGPRDKPLNTFAAFGTPTTQVRDHAVAVLARELKLPYRPFALEHGPLVRYALRATVTKLANDELEKFKE